jgi:hypothetical protein
MAIFTGTLLSFTAKGQREALADAIYDVSPQDCPLVSMAAKETEDASLFEWGTDALAAADNDNAQVQGADYTSVATITPTVRMANYMQISSKTLAISGTLQAVKSAGNANSIERQVARRGIQLKLDMEAGLLANQGGYAGASDDPAYTAKLLAFIKTNVDKAGDGANPTYTSGVPAVVGQTYGRLDGTQRAFTETILKAIIALGWTNGATIEGKYLFVGPVNKAKVSAFEGIAAQTYDISGRTPGQSTIVGAADVYVSDFGTLTVLPSRFQRERDAFLVDPDMIAISHLRPFEVVDLAKTGDADKKLLQQEWGVKVRNEKGLCLAADLTTT